MTDQFLRWEKVGVGVPKHEGQYLIHRADNPRHGQRCVRRVIVAECRHVRTAYGVDAIIWHISHSSMAVKNVTHFCEITTEHYPEGYK